MNHKIPRCLSIISVLILVLSFSAFITNWLLYKFPGNNYFPDNTPVLAVIIVLIYLGLILIFGKNSRISNIGKELVYFFAVMSLIALATNAVQLTPFATIDQSISILEARFGVNMNGVIEWTAQHPNFKLMLHFIYNTLPYQMCLIPLIVIVMGRFELMHNYYFLMLVTACIGFSFYYFFPTMAPASVNNNSLFTPDQIATGLKFHEIHHYIQPSTIEGGLIALPSFHCIWALLCVYLLQEWLFIATGLFIVNFLLILACVLLGWHYPSDIIAGVIVLGLGYYLLLRCSNRQEQ